jgi:hypothetical protein
VAEPTGSATISSVGEKNHIYVQDVDGQLGRMETNAAGRPVGMRDVLTPQGQWVPYYCDGSPISEDAARALAAEWGVDNVDLNGPRVAPPKDAEDSVEKDPYGG